MIGSTIAEMIVIQVRVSMAAKTVERELTQASKIFFVSFINRPFAYALFSAISMDLSFTNPSERDLPVQVCEDHNGRDNRDADPNFSRQTY